MNHHHNFSMRQDQVQEWRHRHPVVRSRLPQNNFETQFGHHDNNGYDRSPPRSGAEAMHRFPRFPFPQIFRQQQTFETRFHPYFRQERPWNTADLRRRPPVRMAPRTAWVPITGPPCQNGHIERRMHLTHREQEKFQQTQYVLRTNIGEERESYHRRTNSYFGDVCASVNFRIRSGSFKMPVLEASERRKNTRSNNAPSNDDDNEVADPDHTTGHLVGFDGGTGTSSTDSSDEDSVAVGSEVASPLRSDDDIIVPNNFESENDVEIFTGDAVEEYKPESPGMSRSTEECTTGSQESFELRMASCDDEGFHEACVGVCISRYPSLLGRMIEVAGFGVWFSDGSKRNFSGVLNPERLQTLKGIMIYGSARAIEAMKNEGYSSIRINLETTFLNENVLGWISKYMENPQAAPSNWDEVKYHPEILDLCKCATGMIIKWSHCSEVSPKKSGIDKAKQLAKKAADTWRKELLHRQEAVGTSQ